MNQNSPLTVAGAVLAFLERVCLLLAEKVHKRHPYRECRVLGGVLFLLTSCKNDSGMRIRFKHAHWKLKSAQGWLRGFTLQLHNGVHIVYTTCSLNFTEVYTKCAPRVSVYKMCSWAHYVHTFEIFTCTLVTCCVLTKWAHCVQHYFISSLLASISCYFFSIKFWCTLVHTALKIQRASWPAR